MKKLILIMLVVGIWVPALAQKSQSLFEQLTDKYSEQDGFSASMLTKDMFDLYLRKKNVEDNSDVAKALQNLDNIFVLSQSNMETSAQYFRRGYDDSKEAKPQKTEKGNTIHKEILSHYKNGGYTLLKTEKRMGEDVKVYLKKNQSKITALALITNSSMSTNLVELQGDDIDLQNVASLGKAINLRGLEALYKIDNSSQYGHFPSGYFPMSEERIAEFEEQARIMAEKHAKLSEEQLVEIEKQAQMQAQKQMQMADKYREMAEKYGRQPVFLSTPGDTNTTYFIDGKKVEPKEVKAIRSSDIGKYPLGK